MAYSKRPHTTKKRTTPQKTRTLEATGRRVLIDIKKGQWHVFQKYCIEDVQLVQSCRIFPQLYKQNDLNTLFANFFADKYDANILSALEPRSVSRIIGVRHIRDDRYAMKFFSEFVKAVKSSKNEFKPEIGMHIPALDPVETEGPAIKAKAASNCDWRIDFTRRGNRWMVTRLVLIIR